MKNDDEGVTSTLAGNQDGEWDTIGTRQDGRDRDSGLLKARRLSLKRGNLTTPESEEQCGRHRHSCIPLLVELKRLSARSRSSKYLLRVQGLLRSGRLCQLLYSTIYMVALKIKNRNFSWLDTTETLDSQESISLRY